MKSKKNKIKTNQWKGDRSPAGDIRRMAGVPYENALEVILVDGDSPPTVVGESYYWETPAGDVCWAPNAYRKAFGNPIYIPSTRRVEVGRDFIVHPLSPRGRVCTVLPGIPAFALLENEEQEDVLHRWKHENENDDSIDFAGFLRFASA